MVTKKISNSETMAKHTAMALAVAMFVLGFFSGIGVAVYKQNFTPGLASKSSTDTDYSKKAKALEQEVLNRPENAEAWIQLGHIYYDMDKHDQAVAAYEKSLELNPNNTDMLTDLGTAYRRSSNQETL